MKKTQNKHLFRTIKKNGVSFFAVAFIAATSIAIFLGIQEAAYSILDGAEDFFKEQKLATWEVTCQNGITQNDIEEISKWEDVDKAEGGYSAMVLAEGETEKLTVNAVSLGEDINIPVVLEGTLPAFINEVAVEQTYAQDENLKVGDSLKLLHDGCLLEEEFTITAIVNMPVYNCVSVNDARGKSDEGFGSASYYVQLLAEAFDPQYYNDCYTVAYLLNEELCDIDYYNDEYTKLEEEIELRLEEKGKERAYARYEELKDIPGVSLQEWNMLGRNDIGDVRGIRTEVDALFKLSYSLALIFLIVAIVVCYAAIMRMINEQKSLIGAQKAQGFTSKSILFHYMKYSFLCALLGILIGWLASVVIVQILILYIFGDDFVMDHYSLTFIWPEALWVALLFFAIFLTATYIACKKLVKLPAIELLRGEVPGQSKEYFFEKWKAYKKLKLYSRLMIKNVLGDKERMLTTIMGVVGCIALLVICFSLKLSIVNAPVKQFEEYFLYENRLAIDSSKGTKEQFEQVLEEEGISYVCVQDKLKNFRIPGEEWENVHVLTSDDGEKLKEYIVLEDADTKEMCELPSEGLYVSKRCAEKMDLSKGSIIELMDANGNTREFEIRGIISHYLPYHLFVASESYYESVMEEEADDCIFLLKGNVDGLLEKVSKIDGYLSLKDNSEYMATASSIDLVIAICLTLSAVIAVLVLLNQVTMHISKKARELSVMRINGYTMKETKAFVYRDNIVLTILGLILGGGIGMALAYVEIRIIETGANSYIRMPSIYAALLACIIGAVFALIVNIIGLRKIDHLNLTNVSSN